MLPQYEPPTTQPTEEDITSSEFTNADEIETTVAGPFREMWQNNRSALPGRYSHNEGMEVVTRNPDLTLLYLPFLEKHKCFQNVLTLIDSAPTHAESLLPIFEEVPQLVSLYASRVNSLGEGDGQIYLNRIDKTSDPDIVQDHLRHSRKIEQHLETILGESSCRTIATPFDGSVKIDLERLTGSSEGTSGVMVWIRPNHEVDPNTDFVSRKTIFLANGIIDTSANTTEVSEIGYLLKKYTFLDETKFFDALINNTPDTPELNEALDEILLDYVTQ